MVVSQVRTEPACGVETGGSAPGPLEGLLGDVFGQTGVTDHRERHAEDVSLEAPHEGQPDVRPAGTQPGQ